MEPTRITHERVEQEDLDTRYLAGTLSEEEADAFEEHYFSCDECWSAVQLGLGVRAAETPEKADTRGAPLKVQRTGVAPSTIAPRRRQWMPVALAAAVAIMAFGLWQWNDNPRMRPADDALRGPTDSIRAVASVRGRALVLSWLATAGADRYGVRLQTRDGTIIVERLTADTSLALSRDSLPAISESEPVYWEVRALDALRRTIARSRLVPARMPPRRR